MNKLQMKVFSPKQLSQLKEIKPDEKWQGFFYVVEYGDYIKIGSSINPYNRYQTFVTAAKYSRKQMGRMAISCSHTNFRQNEHKLHKQYSEHRIEKTELFDLPFNKVVKECWKTVKYDFEDNHSWNDENLKWIIQTLWGDRERIKKRNTALLTALLANCPLLGIGSYDELLITEDLKFAASKNKQVERCLIELGLITAVPFLKECRQSSDRPQNNILRDHALRTGKLMEDFNIEIPIEEILSMEEGGIYDFS